MYEEHPCFKSPSNKNVKVWRYQDFTKFVSLISKSKLFFPWASFLSDKFEGKYPIGTIESLKKLIEENPDLNIEDFKLDKTDDLRKCIGVNSWYMNNFESAAMWKLYVKSDECIAIQSTFNRLKNAFKDETEKIYIGKIKYLDYEKSIIPMENIFHPYLCKRKSFDYENEIRAVLMKLPLVNHKIDFDNMPLGRGIYIKVDLNELIENIVVSPTSEEWFKELVESVVDRYNIKKPIITSKLSERPVY